MVLQTYTYTCGSLIFPDDHNLAQEIFIRVQISCDSPIELLYYSLKKVGNIPICYWCDINSDFEIVPQNLQEKFKLIYLLCNTCNENGKSFYKQLEKKVNRKKQKTNHN